jgi:CDGSH-type Zn-finger protein
MKDAERRLKIVVTENGPYVVSGDVPVSIQVITPNPEGFSWDWTEGRSFDVESSYALCRCGQSSNKPFCDNTHKTAEFNGQETASRIPYTRQADVFDGPTLTLSDAQDLCAFARFCDAGGKIWSLIEQTNAPDARALVIREASHCPAGRLVVRD